MVNPRLSVNSVVTRAQGLVSTPLGSDIVILNPAGDNYVGLNVVARRVWELLAEPCAVGNLCLQLEREFDGDPQQIAADVFSLLNELAAENLVYVATK